MLRERAITGVKWTGLSMAIVTLVQFAQVAVLARVLDPRDFGLMAVMMIAINFAQTFMDMGISKAIVQRQELSRAQLSSLYWLNIASGLAMTIIVAMLSPLIAVFYGEPLIQPLIVQLSFMFLIISIGNQYRVLCQKELEFGRMAAVEIGAALASFAVAATLASQGYGVRALVYAVMAQATLSSFLFLAHGLKRYHCPALVYRHQEIKSFFTFGFYQMGENAVNYISANMDKILIGKMLGMQAAGFYNLAWQLIIFPVTKINPVVNKVALPVYARLQEDAAETQIYYETSMRALSLITIPALVGLCLFAQDVVRVLYGEGWNETATLIQILSAAGIVKALSNPAGALILAKGRADIGFWWNAVWATSISAALYITLKYSGDTQGAALCVTGMSILFGLFWHVLVHKVCGVRYKKILSHFAWVLGASVTACFSARILIDWCGIEHAFARLTAAAIIAGTIYGAYLVIKERWLITALIRRKA